MRRHKTWLANALALAVLALLAARTANAGELVPFRGRDVGILSLESVDFGLGVAVLVQEAEGHATHLGKLRARTTTIVDLATGAPVFISTTFHAVNGDTLVTSEVPIGAPDAFTIILSATITGGTGRFDGAHGAYRSVTRGDKPLVVANLPIRLTSVWDGAVSSPGAK
jgi:hypothetical protein